METPTHRQLKRLVGAYLLREGYLAVAREVRCPASRYRVDVAGWLDRMPWPRESSPDGTTLWATVPTKRRRARDLRCEPRTVLVECKQSRGDFLRDSRKRDQLLAERDDLLNWKKHLEETRIKPHEPELRETDTALFPELEAWDFNASRLDAYRRLMRRLRRVEAQLYGETKFSLIARYRLADHLFLAAPTGLLQPRELPAGWGLLECSREFLRSWKGHPRELPDDAIRIAKEPESHPSKPAFRERMLRNIAIAATFAIVPRAKKKDASADAPASEASPPPPPLPFLKGEVGREATG